MKKIDFDDVELRQRKLKYDISSNIFDDYTYQLEMIINAFEKKNYHEKVIVERELTAKINSYKSQDKKKDLHDVKNLITIEQVIEKLMKSKLKCCYCNCEILVLYNKVRDKRQWTLDRINNYDEHTKDNTVVCCLGCNLQRRRQNSEKFKFTKQLVTNEMIIKKIE